MSEQEKRTAIVTYLVKNGVVLPDAQEKAINEMAANLPEAVAQEKGLTSNIDKAYEAYVSQGVFEAPAEGGATKTRAAKATTAPIAEATTEELQAIRKAMAASQAASEAMRASASISKLLLLRPDPNDYLPANYEAPVNLEAWKKIVEKINDGTYTVKADDGADVTDPVASTTNYKKITDAIAANSAATFAVHRGKLNTRPAGYLVSYKNEAGQQVTNEQLKRNELLNLLTLKLSYILATPSTPGASLRYISPKTDGDGKKTMAKVVVKDENKKEAIKASAFDIITEAQPGTTTKMALRSELAFRVVDNKKKKKGKDENIERLIRVPLKSEDLPKFAPKEEYAAKFTQQSNSDFTQEPTGKQLLKIQDATVNARALLMKVAAAPTMAGSSYANMFDLTQRDLTQQVQSIAPTAAPSVNL